MYYSLARSPLRLPGSADIQKRVGAQLKPHCSSRKAFHEQLRRAVQWAMSHAFLEPLGCISCGMDMEIKESGAQAVAEPRASHAWRALVSGARGFLGIDRPK